MILKFPPGWSSGRASPSDIPAFILLPSTTVSWIVWTLLHTAVASTSITFQSASLAASKRNGTSGVKLNTAGSTVSLFYLTKLKPKQTVHENPSWTNFSSSNLTGLLNVWLHRCLCTELCRPLCLSSSIQLQIWRLSSFMLFSHTPECSRLTSAFTPADDH